MTAVEWLIDQIIKYDLVPQGTNPDNVLFHQALKMEKQQIKDYAIFAVNCDRKGLPVLDFEDYIKLQSNL